MPKQSKSGTPTTDTPFYADPEVKWGIHHLHVSQRLPLDEQCEECESVHDLIVMNSEQAKDTAEKILAELANGPPGVVDPSEKPLDQGDHGRGQRDGQDE